jgi:hypothetical protein
MRRQTYAEVAANTSIFRALVMRASARENKADSTTIIPSRSPLLWTTYRIMTEQRGRTEATTVVATLAIICIVVSLYS